MADVEYLANEVKTGQDVTTTKFEPARVILEPASVIRAGRGIPVHLGATTLDLLSAPEDGSWVMKGILHPGEAVPLHRHSDMEDFYLVSGEAEVLVQTQQGLEWKAARGGDFIHIPGNVKHAWRNGRSFPVEMIVVTPAKLGRFLQELGELTRTSGRNGIVETARRLAERYGYWLGSPQENAAVGISLP
jgi:quercetin dioxygenase-like cupin family protein